MLRNCFYIFLFTLVFSGKAQVNLVPNPSFESYTACPTGTNTNEIENAYWINPTTYSPDYYNACDTYTPAYYSNGVPLNMEGFQAAKTGNAYVGIITMYGYGNNAREYIQALLTNSLIAGTLYYVSFYVSVGDSSPYVSNNIGLYFSTTPISGNNNNNLPYSPQISNNPQTNPLTNKTGWTLVSGTYTALGGEKYITIGNFNDDVSTNTFTFSGYTPQQIASNYSYHYIDDVTVSISTNLREGVTSTEDLTIYPNPSSGIFGVQKENMSKIFIYNSTGKIVLSISEINSNFINLDLSEVPKGFYYLKLFTTSSMHQAKLLIN